MIDYSNLILLSHLSSFTLFSLFVLFSTFLFNSSTSFFLTVHVFLVTCVCGFVSHLIVSFFEFLPLPMRLFYHRLVEFGFTMISSFDSFVSVLIVWVPSSSILLLILLLFLLFIYSHFCLAAASSLDFAPPPLSTVFISCLSYLQPHSPIPASFSKTLCSYHEALDYHHLDPPRLPSFFRPSSPCHSSSSLPPPRLLFCPCCSYALQPSSPSFSLPLVFLFIRVTQQVKGQLSS